MQKNLRGELTVMPAPLQLQPPRLSLAQGNFVETVISALGAESDPEREVIERALLPHLICSTAGLGDVEGFMRLKEAARNESLVTTCVDFEGRTALHLAASSGHYDMVKELLLLGASVHLRDRNQMTPVAWACRHGYADIAKLLVQTGANFDANDDEAVHHFFKCVHRSDAAAYGNRCVMNNDAKRVELYLACGLDPNMRFVNRQTALHLVRFYRGFYLDIRRAFKATLA
jgi:lysophospholipase